MVQWFPYLTIQLPMFPNNNLLLKAMLNVICDAIWCHKKEMGYINHINITTCMIGIYIYEIEIMYVQHIEQ